MCPGGKLRENINKNIFKTPPRHRGDYCPGHAAAIANGLEQDRRPIVRECRNHRVINKKKKKNRDEGAVADVKIRRGDF